MVLGVLPIGFCFLPTAVASCRGLAARCLLFMPIAYCLLRTACRLPATAASLLLSAFCLLPTAFCLLLSAYYVMRDALQNPGARAVGFQGLAGLFHQARSDSLGGFDAVQRGVSGLVLLFVFANGFAQFGLGSQHIEQIVGNLKCQADLFSVSRNAGQIVLVRLALESRRSAPRPA